MTERHRLTEKDRVALTAICSICGAGAKISRNGKYGFVCVVGRRLAKRRWSKAHPERAREARKFKPSQHRLLKRDGGPDDCRTCGPVEVVAWGRGWMCANRFKELKWTTEQVEPAPKCQACQRRWLVDGKCPQCDRPASELYAGSAAAATAAASGLSIRTSETWLDGDPSVFRVDTSPYAKYAHLADEWSGKEKYVRPEYARLLGSGSR